MAAVRTKCAGKANLNGISSVLNIVDMSPIKMLMISIADNSLGATVIGCPIKIIVIILIKAPIRRPIRAYATPSFIYLKKSPHIPRCFFNSGKYLRLTNALLLSVSFAIIFPEKDVSNISK